MTALPKRFYTLEEYFELERGSNEKFEYFDGEAFSTSGVSRQHDFIEGNINFALKSKLRGRECRNFQANMRIKVPAVTPYRCADASALCGAPVFEKIGGTDVLINSQLIVEILSDSTANYERGLKFTQYKSIESFREYLLIAQDRPHATHFIKQDEKTWLQREYNLPGESFRLTTLDCKISLGEIYQDLAFPENPNPYTLL